MNDKRLVSYFLLPVLLLVLGGCATIPGNPSSMSPEQIKEAVKDKSASVGCATVQTPYKGNALLLNLDAGVLKVGELTVASDCTITIKNGPMPPRATPVAGADSTLTMPVTVPSMTLTPSK